METVLLNARRNIIFTNQPEKLSKNCSDLISKLKKIILDQPEKRKEAVAVAESICIDFKSFLRVWALNKHVQSNAVTEAEIQNEFTKLLSFVEEHGDPGSVDGIRKEVESIRNSSTKKMCDLVHNGDLYTYWGHDYCTGLDHSLRRGACFATTNPAKINNFRKENPEKWNILLKEVESAHPGISAEKKTSYMFMKVVALIARQLVPIYEWSGGQYGFACIQVNPKNWQDADGMKAEIAFWHKEMQNELGMAKPNIVYKIPAVPAAMAVVPEVLRNGHRVCMTLNFTFKQHDWFFDLIRESGGQGFVVLMSGFLDDAVDKELAEMGIKESRSIARHAGEAVIRKSYANLRSKDYRGISIMSAAIRGEWTIKNTLTSSAAMPMYFTTMTEKIMEFDSEPRILTPIVNDLVSDADLNSLYKSSIFRAAYEDDLLTLENIAGYTPLQTVLGIFIKAYDEIEQSLVEKA